MIYYAASVVYAESILASRQAEFTPELKVFDCLLSVCDKGADDEAGVLHLLTGRMEKLLAEVLEESGRLKQAASHFAHARALFGEEGRIEESLRCQINLARWLGLVGEYEQAARQYRSLGYFQFGGDHRRHHSREYFLRCLICWAACLSRNEILLRVESGLRRREMFLAWDPTWADTPEFKLIMLLCDGLCAGDVALFDQFVSEMEEKGLMDSWKARIIPLARQLQFGDTALTADVSTSHEPIEDDAVDIDPTTKMDTVDC